MFKTPRIGEFPSIIVGIVVTLLAVTSGCRLSPEGGYDLVLGIENPDAVPANDQLRYIQNIKTSMQTFSNQLWRATKMRFHINSLELIVPENWTAVYDVNTTYAELGGIQTADFRISPSITFPNAKNPYLCGLPGDHIELPFSFFDNTNSNEFGVLWKSLLVLFARYRYGVWEEHGFIDDDIFPYFYQNGISATWEVTGCNNARLIGKFVNVSHPDKTDCEMSWSTPTSDLSGCRFIPDPTENTVTTSLMHFHWLDSVVDFCDEDTHNSFSDNKQNAFCDQKSIMQVIRESPDYATATNPRTEVPPIIFKTVRQSAKPLLYILLDRGEIQGSYELANMIPPALAQFLGRANIQDVIAGVGSYPNPENAAIQLKHEVGWAQIGTNKEQFLQAVGDLKINGSLQRDFGKAIIEAAELIKTRGHAAGAVILIVKLGADMNNLNTSVPEKDVLLALNDQKIILHSIELPITGMPPVAQLAQLTSDTTGGFVAITNPIEATTAMNNVFNYLANTVNSPVYITDAPTSRIVVKQTISSTLNGADVTIPSSAKLVEVFYTSVHRLDRSNFTTLIDGVVANTSVTSFRRSADWQAENIAGYSYRIRFNAASIAGKRIASVRLNCAELPGVCEGVIIGRVVIDEAKTSVVKIEVATSSNDVDLGKNVPLTIFAKATVNGIPIRNTRLATIYAEAILTNGVLTQVVELHDDGSIPDILATDGTFSANVAPNQDGDYRITVRFMKRTGGFRQLLGEVEKTIVRESSSGKLLPIDQSPGGSCEVTNTCPEIIVEDGFVQEEVVPIPVRITNSTLYRRRPSKVLLSIRYGMILRWFSPRVPGLSAAVDRYEIRQSPNRDELITNFDGCDIAATVAVIPPGQEQSVQLPITVNTMYYALKSVFQDIKSERSNIRVIPGFQQATTTPTTPTSETDPDTTTDVSTTDTTPETTLPPDPFPPTTPTTSGPTSGTTTQQSPSNKDDKRWVESPAGIGTICGIIAAIILVAGLVLCFRRRRSGSRRISG